MHHQEIPHCQTGGVEDEDFEIQHTKELDQADTELDNIAWMEQDGADEPNSQVQRKDEMDILNVDRWVVVFVSVVTVLAVELPSELNRSHSHSQCCSLSSAAVRAAVRVAVRV